MTNLGIGFRPAIRTRIRDGVLVFDKILHRKDFVADVNIAVPDLLAGKTIWLVQFGPVVSQVQKTMEMVLRQAAITEEDSELSE